MENLLPLMDLVIKMAVGDLHQQVVVGSGSTITWQPLATTEFLITSILQGYRVRLNLTDGTNSTQIVHGVVKLDSGDNTGDTINIQKIFVSNSFYWEWDSIGVGETSSITAIQTK